MVDTEQDEASVIFHKICWPFHTVIGPDYILLRRIYLSTGSF